MKNADSYRKIKLNWLKKRNSKTALELNFENPLAITLVASNPSISESSVHHMAASRKAGTDGEISLMKGLKTAGPAIRCLEEEKREAGGADAAGGGGGGGGCWVEVEAVAGGWTSALMHAGRRRRRGSGRGVHR